MPPPFQSVILRGNGPNARLEQAASKPPSIKKGPPADDVEAVKRIQRGLIKLSGHPMPISFPNGPDGEPDGKFGQETFDAVVAFQKKVFPGQPNEHDGKVGIKTLEKMDALLPKGGGGGGPTPPPPPVVGMAGVAVGPVGANSKLVDDYYHHCGLETVGPGQVTTGPPRSFRTFEGLIDDLLVRPELQQVIVCHGEPSKGLIVPVSPKTNFRDTSQVIFDLSDLADKVDRGQPLTTPASQNSIQSISRKTRLARADILAIVQKLVLVRKKQLVVHFRACNMREDLVTGYKLAFGARLATFHEVRLLFLRIEVKEFINGNTAAKLKTVPNTRTERTRMFEDSLGELSSLAIGVQDQNGHEKVRSFTGIDRFSTADVKAWAEVFIRKWDAANPSEFVIPAMWDDNDLTFHFPLESGWRSKLKFVV